MIFVVGDKCEQFEATPFLDVFDINMKDYSLEL
jgi:hypothetical protein